MALNELTVGEVLKLVNSKIVRLRDGSVDWTATREWREGDIRHLPSPGEGFDYQFNDKHELKVVPLEDGSSPVERKRRSYVTTPRKNRYFVSC